MIIIWSVRVVFGSLVAARRTYLNTGPTRDRAFFKAVSKPLYRWTTGNRQYQPVMLPESSFRKACRAHLSQYKRVYNSRYQWFNGLNRSIERGAYESALVRLRGKWSDDRLFELIDRCSENVARGYWNRSVLHDGIMALYKRARLNQTKDYCFSLAPRYLSQKADATDNICYHSACGQEAKRYKSTVESLVQENRTLKALHEQFCTQAAALTRRSAQQDIHLTGAHINWATLLSVPPSTTDVSLGLAQSADASPPTGTEAGSIVVARNASR